MAKSKNQKSKNKALTDLDSFRNEILDDAITLCREEALEYEKHGAACDLNGNYLGAYGDYQSGATCRYLMEKILELKINV